MPEDVTILNPTTNDFEKFVHGKWKCIKAGLYTTEDSEGNQHADDDPVYGVKGYSLEYITFTEDKIHFQFANPVLVEDMLEGPTYTTEFICDKNSFGSCFSPYILTYNDSLGEHISHPYYYDNNGTPQEFSRNWGKMQLYGIEDDVIKRVDYMLFYGSYDRLVYELKRVK